jgi:hypothetical protein
MAVITGIGWITQREYGCVIKGLRRGYSDAGSLREDLEKDSVLSYPMKRFGKYDLNSKMTCCVVGLALYDAGIVYSESQKQDIGILGTNTAGCLQSNLDYFSDFSDNGRTRARAGLFVYTLSSIPISEAAMYFKMRGPLVHMTFAERQLESLLNLSAGMILRGECVAMLAVQASEEEGLCLVLNREEDVSNEAVFNTEEVSAIADEASGLDELIAKLGNV